MTAGIGTVLCCVSQIGPVRWGEGVLAMGDTSQSYAGKEQDIVGVVGLCWVEADVKLLQRIWCLKWPGSAAIGSLLC